MYYNISKTCQIDHDFLDDLYYRLHLGKNGIFVDVGAADGLECSNASGLAEAGWSGLLIEPNPQSFAQCFHRYLNYDNVRTLHMGASNKEEALDLYMRAALSTFCKTGIPFDRVQQEGCLGVVSVLCLPLDIILEENGIKHIDVLSIDVEGFEDKVLEGFSIEKYRPKIVIIELHAGTRPDTGAPSTFKNENLIERCRKHFGDYNLIYSDHINDIYERKPC